MKCPFGYPTPRRRSRRYSFGVAGDFVDFVEEREDQRMAAEYKRQAEFNLQYPTCWAKFKHWWRRDAWPE